MLKLTDTGVEIRLTGTPTPNYAFVFSGILGVFALLVAYLAITQPVGVAIGGMFGLAVGCFLFNRYKEQIKNQPICNGTIVARAGHLDLSGQLIDLSQSTNIEIHDNLLIIKDNHKSWQIGGFDNEKEMVVLKAVLLGQEITQRNANIRMQK